MDERTLQTLSKALTLLIFRMGAVEKLHAIGACLDDESMKKLNMDIYYATFDLKKQVRKLYTSIIKIDASLYTPVTTAIGILCSFTTSLIFREKTVFTHILRQFLP